MFQFSDKCFEPVQQHKFLPEQATEVCYLEPDLGKVTFWREIAWFTTELAKKAAKLEVHFVLVYPSY